MMNSISMFFSDKFNKSLVSDKIHHLKTAAGSGPPSREDWLFFKSETNSQLIYKSYLSDSLCTDIAKSLEGRLWAFVPSLALETNFIHPFVNYRAHPSF